MYDSTLIQDTQITIKYAKLRPLVTHYCLHVSLGLFAVQKGAHTEFSQGCASKRSSSLWGPDPRAEGRKARGLAQLRVTWDWTQPLTKVAFSLQEKTQSPPRGKVPPSRGCSILLHVGNASLAHTATFSSFFQMYFFSSIVSCCCLMLYRVCLSS